MDSTPNNPFSLGDILDKVVRKSRRARKALGKRDQAQKVFAELLPQYAQHSRVHSVKVGVVTIEADSSVLFQELESFHREQLKEAFRGAGLSVHDVRVKLAEQ